MSGIRGVCRGVVASLALATVLAGCDVGTGPSGSQPLGSRILDAETLGSTWAWLPVGGEIAFVGSAGELAAVHGETGGVRNLVPDGTGTVQDFRVAEPYVYFLADARLHRVTIDGGNAESLPVGFDPSNDWAVAVGSDWVFWADSGAVIRARVDTGTPDTIRVDRTAGRRLFVAPGGTALLLVDWAVWPGEASWVRVEGGTVATDRVPCRLGEGTVVRWEGGAPVVYAACPDVFARQPVGADSSRLAVIGGGQDGAWSTALERVSAWRRICHRWSDFTCPDAERELWIAEIGGRPRRVGTLIADARERLDDTSPAYFSPAGGRVAFRLSAGGDQDGLHVLRVD